MQIFPTTAGADILSGITDTITSNVGVVVAVLAGIVGLKIGAKLLNGAKSGKVRI